MQRLLDFPFRQTFDATLKAYCGHIEELCLYAGEMVSEWNSVVEGGLGNCMSLSVLSQESSVMRQTWQKTSKPNDRSCFWFQYIRLCTTHTVR